MTAFGLVLLSIVGIVVSVTLNGYALSVLWGWFVVPALGAPALRIPYAIGLSLVVAMLTHQQRKSEHTPEFAEALLSGLITPFLMLLLGWIVKQFI